jgi:hypothetical protein
VIKEHGLAGLALDALQLDIHALAGHGVERAERLVHQHDLRVMHQRAADRGALLHTAGQLPGQFFLESLEPDHFSAAPSRAADIFRATDCFMSIGSSTLFKTLRHGSSSEFWNTMPTLPCGFVTSLAVDQEFPPTTAPAGPRIIFRSVDLPQPDGPTTTKNSPSVDVKIQRPQRRHVAVARPVGFGHAGNPDTRGAGSGVRDRAQMRGVLPDAGCRRAHRARSYFGR